MAKLSDLIPTLARILPMPEQTVAVIARALRQERLISTGGRGPGAADMTPDDCANLLLAIMAADQVKGAVDAVREFRSLTMEAVHCRDAAADGEEDDWLPLPPAMRRLLVVRDFGEMLSGLIAAARDEVLHKALDDVALPFMKIEVERRFRTASVSLSGSSNELAPPQPVLIATFGIPEGPERERIEQEDFAAGGDAMITFAIGHRTIIALGALIRS